MPAVQWMARQVTSGKTLQSIRKSPEGSPSPWSPDEFDVNLALTFRFDCFESEDFREPLMWFTTPVCGRSVLNGFSLIATIPYQSSRIFDATSSQKITIAARLDSIA